MSTAFQASLLDVGAEFGLGDLGRIERRVLGDGAWVDVLPGWMSGGDDLFDRLVRKVPWRAERRPMYDQIVDVPRLLSWYGRGERLPDPALDEAMTALDRHYRLRVSEDALDRGYRLRVSEELCTAGLCLYRDGRDSVAWHGDTSGRRVRETIVAILSLGNPRALHLRPRGGGAGRALRFLLGHGDLLVMGGTCQRTWEHSVPKSAQATGPRISVQFRPEGIH